jgi:ABC-type dipeptide/oligopeptide/nickel transport system permease subunit
MVEAVESLYAIWESGFNSTDQKWGYSNTAQGVGVGLQVASVAIGGAQLRNQITNGKPIDPINAAQVGVGTVGLGASLLSYLGIGGTITSSISAYTGVIGLVLGIPGNWSMVYQGAFDMQYQTTANYPSDSEVFGGH